MTFKELRSIVSLKVGEYDFGTKFGVSAVLEDGRRIIIAKGVIEGDEP